MPSANQAGFCHADFSFGDLVQAYFDCRRHKRTSRSALDFECSLEENLGRLDDELVSGTYRRGPSTCFAITRPKPREVWAANFRDRVVEHLLYNRIAERFHARFIADTCACIPGRGTLYAARRLEAKVRSITQNWTRQAYYLKCDIANFFVSIDKARVMELIAEHVHEPWWLELARLVVMNDPRTEVFIQGDRAHLELIPPHKSLFRQPAGFGLPIGNLFSQFSANVYMDVVDQHAKHVVGARYYLRYVDDITILHESSEWLARACESIERVLVAELGLRLNPRKTIIQPLSRGIDFAGHVIKPWRRTIRRRVVNDALHRAAATPDSFTTLNSYFGLFRQASHSHGDRRRLARLALRRDHTVDLALTKTFRRGTP